MFYSVRPADFLSSKVTLIQTSELCCSRGGMFIFPDISLLFTTQYCRYWSGEPVFDERECHCQLRQTVTPQHKASHVNITPPPPHDTDANPIIWQTPALPGHLITGTKNNYNTWKWQGVCKFSYFAFVNCTKV